jgi:hypothetical protein
VQFTFGQTRLELAPQALLCCRWADGEVPVLAFLCDSERLQAPPRYLRRPRQNDLQLPRVNNWGDFGVYLKPIVDARPPPPYGLALLIGMEQMQHRLCSKPSTTDTYQVCEHRIWFWPAVLHIFFIL